MRRLLLAGVVLAAVVTSWSASARTFRTDLNPCDSPDSSFVTVCWDGLPSGAIPQLPINGETTFSSTTGNASARFSTSSFDLIAFDYAQFVADNASFFGGHVIADPYTVISHGLSRPDTRGDTPFLATDTPLLRINWFFDVALLPTFANLFEDVQTINNVDYFGVQLIFNGQGFELNGLTAAGMAYSSSATSDGTPIWNGATQPCATFDNSGACALLPEPPSLALFGLGLAVLVAGLRTRPRTTARPA